MRTATITIEATFGSDFQADAALNALKPLLDTWATFVREKHKRNEVDWSVVTGPAKKRAARR